jgi:hypothetical protein
VTGQVRPSRALQMSIFPHENDTRAPRAAKGLSHWALGPRGGLSKRGPRPGQPIKLTQTFAANTCPACHHITIAGITELGFTLHLEPLQLTDLDEARAIADDVETFNLFPDRRVRQRWLTHIRHPATVPRHARHVCGTTYGTQAPPAPAQRPHLPDSPPF